jgi:hypothetical protein
MHRDKYFSCKSVSLGCGTLFEVYNEEDNNYEKEQG